MATYNLQSGRDLNNLLGSVKSAADAESVKMWSEWLGFTPSRHNPLTAVVENQGNSAGTPYTLGGSHEMFLFSGATGATAFVSDAQGGNILADPGSITYLGPTMAGATGGDTLLGAAGSTLSVMSGNNALVSMSGQSTLIGGSGNDTLAGGYVAGAADVLQAGSGNDKLYAYHGNNSLLAGTGFDYLQGGDGADTLMGGAGTSTLYAGTGQNVLEGGSGRTWLYGHWGGPGTHYDFLYSGTDPASQTTMYGGTVGAEEILKGGSNLVVGGPSWDWVQAGNSPGAEHDSIYGGHYTVITEANASTDIASQTVVGGVTQITFSNGQTLDSWNAKIIFSDKVVIKT